MPKHRVTIVKLFLPKEEKNIDRPKAFSRIPQLYLELLENKAKIKQDLINCDHIPNKSISLSPNQKNSQFNDSEKNENNRNRDNWDQNRDSDRNKNKDKDRNEDRDGDRDRDTNRDGDRDRDTNRDGDGDRERDRDRSRDGDRDRSRDGDRDRSRDGDRDRSRDGDRDRSRDGDRDSDIDNPDPKKLEVLDFDQGSLHSGDEIKENVDSNYENKHRDKRDDNSVVSTQDISTRLLQLLDDSDEKESFSPDKYSRSLEDKFQYKSSHRSSSYQDIREQEFQSPNQSPEQSPGQSPLPHGQAAPTLRELEQQGMYRKKEHLRDINQVNMNEKENEDKRRELLFKFDLLKKSYPVSSIPEFTIHSDLETMQKSYEDSVRRLSLNDKVENYKTYLIGGFMLVEFIFGNFLGFDMQGFTQQQIVSMNSYEKLLIELGEKSYLPKGSKWPVELRLLFMIIMNAAFWIVSKMILKKTGANLMNMINGMNRSSSPPIRKRKMRGPNINLEDLPNN